MRTGAGVAGDYYLRGGIGFDWPAELVFTDNQSSSTVRKHVALDGGGAEHGTAAIGLGLAICKGLVEAHGGRIRAETAGIGKGARFTFTLPVTEGGDGAAKTRPAAKRSPGRSTGSTGRSTPSCCHPISTG